MGGIGLVKIFNCRIISLISKSLITFYIQLKKNEYEESSEEENAKERLSLFKTSTIHSKKVNKILKMRPLELLGLKFKIAEQN